MTIIIIMRSLKLSDVIRQSNIHMYKLIIIINTIFKGEPCKFKYVSKR